MYTPFTLASKYVHYYLTAGNGKGHGIHSPFVFDFVVHVLNDRRNFYAYTEIELLRNKLLRNTEEIEVEDLGAGSLSSPHRKRAIGSIARHAAKPGKYGKLLFRMVERYEPKNVLELGTSLGISTCYLASAHKQMPVLTLEGAPAVAAQALRNFEDLGLKNIRLITGNFDTTLPKVLEVVGSPDFVFIDGNHRKQTTLNYFHQLVQRVNHRSILIFDDIHWSREMEEAWEEIRKHPSVTLTIDLFFIGIVFFKPEIRQVQHFTIRF
ncbi:MAG: class I SAM-dependent methyltransferase [Chitinophagaceae bacterium]|nr:class I SAM-dependent methyltransferase [Chitinophagaceae bacterium]